MAIRSSINDWPKEEIADGDLLFMRVHKQFFTKNGIHPGAFRDHSGGMSTDWSRYASPEDTRGRARTPEHNAVVQMQVGSVREVPNQRVEHAPLQKNRAHTEVLGEKDEEVRVKFRRISTVVISLGG